jgi:hypothetical protein
MTTADWQPNFSWVTETLAVGGSFPRFAAGELAWRHGIGAVVDLREDACDDVRALRAAGIAFLHLPTPRHFPIEPQKLERGVTFAQKTLRGGSRALIHDGRGIGRSATLALCIMAAEGWRPLDALKRAKDQRALVSPSPAQYRCWTDWLARWKARHGADWEIPDFVSFGSVAYRCLSPQA